MSSDEQQTGARAARQAGRRHRTPSTVIGRFMREGDWLVSEPIRGTEAEQGGSDWTVRGSTVSRSHS